MVRPGGMTKYRRSHFRVMSPSEAREIGDIAAQQYFAVHEFRGDLDKKFAEAVARGRYGDPDDSLVGKILDKVRADREKDNFNLKDERYKIQLEREEIERQKDAVKAKSEEIEQQKVAMKNRDDNIRQEVVQVKLSVGNELYAAAPARACCCEDCGQIPRLRECPVCRRAIAHRAGLYFS